MQESHVCPTLFCFVHVIIVIDVLRHSQLKTPKTLNPEPLTLGPSVLADADKAAAQRGLDFNLGWFADPLWFGDYPASMKKCVKEDLPEFTAEEKEMVKGSLDFQGINFYTGK